jgi:hypothetical protein
VCITDENLWSIPSKTITRMPTDDRQIGKLKSLIFIATPRINILRQKGPTSICGPFQIRLYYDCLLTTDEKNSRNKKFSLIRKSLIFFAKPRIIILRQKDYYNVIKNVKLHCESVQVQKVVIRDSFLFFFGPKTNI